MAFLFNIGACSLLSTGFSWEGATIKGRLVTVAAGAPAKDADVMTGIGSTEASATATVVDACGPVKDDTNDLVQFTSDPVTFSAASTAIGACDRMVLFSFGTTDADSVPIASIDLSASVTPTGADVTVTPGTFGWFYSQQ